MTAIARTGYLRFARAFQFNEKSPFFQQISLFNVFRVLCEMAPYKTGRASQVGVIDFSLRYLAKFVNLEFSSIRHVINKLADMGAIKVLERRPNFKVEIVCYEFLDDFDKYLEARKAYQNIENMLGPDRITLKKTGQIFNQLKLQDDIDVSQTWENHHSTPRSQTQRLEFTLESEEKNFGQNTHSTPQNSIPHEPENITTKDLYEILEENNPIPHFGALSNNSLNNNYININNNTGAHKVITSSDTSIPGCLQHPVAVELQKVTSIDDIDPSISLLKTEPDEVLIPTSISRERTEGDTASRDEALQSFLPKTDIDVVQSHAEANLMKRKLEIETMLRTNKPLETNSAHFGKQLSDEERAKLRSEKQTIQIALADALKIEQKQPYNAPEISPANIDTPKALENDLRLHAPIPYLEVEVPLVSDEQVSSFVESLTKRFLELRTQRHRQERERVYRIDPSRIVMPLDHSPEEVQRFKSIFHELEKDLTHRDLLDLIEFTYARAGVRDHFDPQMFVNRVYGIPQAVEWLQDLRKNKR